MKRIVSCLLILLVLTGLCACNTKKKDNKLNSIEKPKAAATADEVSAPEVDKNAVESSQNVNGMRFKTTLREFTSRYNTELNNRGEKGQLVFEKWQQTEKPSKDDNGVEVQYWYYDDENVTMTASVETKSGKLMNIGVATTTSKFMGNTGEENNSDLILAQAAQVAQIVCGFPSGSEPVLQDIFFRTTTEDKDLWYEGFVFARSTKEDSTDSKNSIMQFRVFPITDELKNEWKLEEYK